MECLTRTGPLVALKKEDQLPLPNLARSWEWSEDGMQLTMQLIEGARWSDGDPFDADDILFHWQDNILDPQVASWASADSFGAGATLERLDDYSVRWTFKQPNNTLALFQMAFLNFCPGPSHLLKPLHPKYNPANTYNDYLNTLPTEKLQLATMGAWVPVDYKADELIVLRRNPYFWKVDDAGNQADALRDAARYEMAIQRTEKDFIVPLQQPDSIAPLHSKAARWHRGSDDHPQHLLPDHPGRDAGQWHWPGPYRSRAAGGQGPDRCRAWRLCTEPLSARIFRRPAPAYRYP
jgi:hypothetical protein